MIPNKVTGPSRRINRLARRGRRVSAPFAPIGGQGTGQRALLSVVIGWHEAAQRMSGCSAKEMIEQFRCLVLAGRPGRILTRLAPARELRDDAPRQG
jgi:hypothetical protein